VGAAGKTFLFQAGICYRQSALSPFGIYPIHNMHQAFLLLPLVFSSKVNMIPAFL
jgi:hypothetical protein